MKIYLAGPMRGSGRADWNLDAFHAAEGRWRDAGHTVMSPAHTLKVMDHTPTDASLNQDRIHLNIAIQIDLACIYAADAIALLPGWENSYGATVEVAMGHFLQLPFYDAETMDLLRIVPKPWSCLDNVEGTDCDQCEGSGWVTRTYGLEETEYDAPCPHCNKVTS